MDGYVQIGQVAKKTKSYDGINFSFSHKFIWKQLTIENKFGLNADSVHIKWKENKIQLRNLVM